MRSSPSPSTCRSTLDTGACGRSGPESVFADRTAASFARSIRRGVEPFHGGVDLHEVELRLSDEGSDLRPFERDRRSFGIVLIVDVGVGEAATTAS